MLASNPVPDLDLVIVVGTFVTVAVTAVPLELTVIKVSPASSVEMAINVADAPSPSTEDKPGVRVRIAEPRVICPPAVITGTDCTGVIARAAFAPGVCCVCTFPPALLSL